jgi:pimeloyl-ACP methyl ester carboxylesterase
MSLRPALHYRRFGRVVRDVSSRGESRPHAQIRIARGSGTARGVVVLLHGGREMSNRATRWAHLPVVRMTAIGRTLHRTLGSAGVEVWRLRFALRGWNGEAAVPTRDARWALAQVRERHGDLPVVLVGHSMGGRTAMRVADDRSVAGVVALAPWLPEHEPVEPVRGKRVFIAHGLQDTRVSAAQSLGWARRAAGVVAELHRVELRDTDHAMLRRIRLWHALTSYAAARFLDLPADVPPGAEALLTAGARSLQLTL